jgi:hypothetical protein
LGWSTRRLAAAPRSVGQPVTKRTKVVNAHTFVGIPASCAEVDQPLAPEVDGVEEDDVHGHHHHAEEAAEDEAGGGVPVGGLVLRRREVSLVAGLARKGRQVRLAVPGWIAGPLRHVGGVARLRLVDAVCRCGDRFDEVLAASAVHAPDAPDVKEGRLRFGPACLVAVVVLVVVVAAVVVPCLVGDAVRLQAARAAEHAVCVVGRDGSVGGASQQVQEQVPQPHPGFKPWTWAWANMLCRLAKRCPQSPSPPIVPSPR